MRGGYRRPRHDCPSPLKGFKLAPALPLPRTTHLPRRAPHPRGAAILSLEDVLPAPRVPGLLRVEGSIRGPSEQAERKGPPDRFATPRFHRCRVTVLEGRANSQPSENSSSRAGINQTSRIIALSTR